jgi:hypothetical protein
VRRFTVFARCTPREKDFVIPRGASLRSPNPT